MRYIICVQKENIYETDSGRRLSYHNEVINIPPDKWLAKEQKRTHEWGDNSNLVIISATPLSDPFLKATRRCLKNFEAINQALIKLVKKLEQEGKIEKGEAEIILRDLSPTV